MKVIRTLSRLYVGNLDESIALYRTLLRKEPEMRFALPGSGVELAQIGELLLIAGTEEALAPFRKIQATFLVDSLDDYRNVLDTAGARSFRGPHAVPTGRGMTVRHPDGSIIEYVEHAHRTGLRPEPDGTTRSGIGENGVIPVVRRAEPRDVPAIVAHNLAMAEETEGRALDQETAARGVGAVFADPSNGCYFVAERNGRIIGQCMVTCEWSDWRCGNFWWIQSVYIEQQWRRRGIFTLLYTSLLQDARARGDVVGIRLYVDRDNRAAQQVYRSLGIPEAHYILYDLDFTVGSVPPGR
jgi:GNAT superfamily N-acetyltransferase